ncbi:MAG TPA: sugar phosphate isomerase/epimerase [Streptosporangiaceae bacterium]|nr:sugar phosphate isomerase/epimerase [Streptosporangiaceae bacterium]
MRHPSPLGIQLYSVRDDIGPADLETTLKRLAGMGFTHAEPYRILDRTEQLGEALAAAGLQVTAAHANVTTSDRDAYFDAAARLGLDTLIVPWTEPDALSSRNGVAAVAAAINDAARRAADRGLRVGYHNHDFEFSQVVDGTAAYEILAEALDGEVVLEVDTFWASMGGADVFELIPRLGSRVRFLHVTNEPPDDDDPPPLGPATTGRMAEVVRLGTPFVQMPVVEAVVHSGDVFPVLERNAAFFLGQS